MHTNLYDIDQSYELWCGRFRMAGKWTAPSLVLHRSSSASQVHFDCLPIDEWLSFLVTTRYRCERHQANMSLFPHSWDLKLIFYSCKAFTSGHDIIQMTRRSQSRYRKQAVHSSRLAKTIYHQKRVSHAMRCSFSPASM